MQLYPFQFSIVNSQEANRMVKRIFCPVCGKKGRIVPFTDNVRESGICPSCGSWNRQRAMALLLTQAIGRMTGSGISHLGQAGERAGSLDIFSAEDFGAVHDRLKCLGGYVWSSYAGPEHRSGDVVDGCLHQDLVATSFPDGRFSIIMTSDVMEHIPEPYSAHDEIYRILKPGGVHIFSVPCDLNNPFDDRRATVVNGAVIHHAPPEWHGPRDNSNLVYTIFGLEMIGRLWKSGFRVRLHNIDDRDRGIVGTGGVLFEAMKHHDPIQ